MESVLQLGLRPLAFSCAHNLRSTRSHRGAYVHLRRSVVTKWIKD